MKVNDLKVSKKEGAGCLIVCSDTDRFLLIQRSEYVPVALTWSLPGGGVDLGETPEEAARREVFEEIGFDLSNMSLHLIYTNEVHAPRFKFYTFACVVDKEFEPKLNYESAAWVWCDFDNMPEPLHWGVSQLINNDKAGKRLKNIIDSSKNH
jgi:8-oxo-dGTP pyrophosphatase MutT (NUDIX family)